MKIFGWLLVVILGVATPCLAGEIVLKTTPEEDQAMGMLLDKLNAERAILATPLPPMTVEDWTTYQAAQYFDGVMTQARAYRDAQLKLAADSASAEVKQQVTNLLTCGKVACQ